MLGWCIQRQGMCGKRYFDRRLGRSPGDPKKFNEDEEFSLAAQRLVPVISRASVESLPPRNPIASSDLYFFLLLAS